MHSTLSREEWVQEPKPVSIAWSYIKVYHIVLTEPYAYESCLCLGYEKFTE